MAEVDAGLKVIFFFWAFVLHNFTQQYLTNKKLEKMDFSYGAPT